LGLKAPTPNRKDARFTFHTRRAVQSAIANLLVYVAEQRVDKSPTIGPVQMQEDDDMRKGNDYLSQSDYIMALLAWLETAIHLYVILDININKMMQLHFVACS